MPPVIAAVGALLTTGSFLAAGAAFTAAGIAAGFASGFAALGSWLLTQVVVFGITSLLAPKQKVPERQADVLQLSLSEGPREIVFGRCATGGRLIDAWNHNSGSGSASQNRSEVLVIKLSDVPIKALKGFWANDEYITFTADGPQTSTGIPAGGLYVWFRSGAAGQTPPAIVVSESLGNWDAAKVMDGCAHVFVEYRDNKDRTIWPSGRPRFIWDVEGAFIYDARKDSTVEGGSGDHRWDDPDTWEWTDNGYLARYQYIRGFFNNGQLMVGRGLNAIEAPPVRAISRANACDEAVALKAGGTEKRYPASGIIRSSEQAIDIEEAFAAAMGGAIVDLDGVVDIDPGVAKIVVPALELTDADLLEREPIVTNPYLSETQRVNTVIAQFVDPTQRYEPVTAPMRRNYADVIADKRSYEVPLDLRFVLSNTQAQRVAEIQRRQGRLEWSIEIPLGPRFIFAEINDWAALSSDRYLEGERKEAAIARVSYAADFRVRLALRETSAWVYEWDETVDEIEPGTVPAVSTPAPDPIEVTGFDVSPASVAGASGSIPGLYVEWEEFVDAAVTGVLIQVRRDGETTITPTTVRDPDALSALVTAGVGPLAEMNVRMRAITNTPGRICAWTDWVDVTSDDLDAGSVGGIPGSDIADAINDDVFTVKEKRRYLPSINDLLNGRTDLEALATAAGVTTELTAYQSAMDDFEDFLATVTSPVAWNNSSDKSSMDGATFESLYTGALAAQTALRAAIDNAASSGGGGGGGTVIGDNTNGTLATLNGTSWLTVDSFTTPSGLTAGQLVSAYLSFIVSATMGTGTMNCEARVVIGSQVIETKTWTIYKDPIDPIEITPPAFTTNFVALAAGGAQTCKLEVRRLSGVATATSVQGRAQCKVI